MAGSDFPFYRPGRSEYDDTMSRASTAVKRKSKVHDEKFALGRRGTLVFFTLSVLTLMAALDGTSLSVALPVSALIKNILRIESNKAQEIAKEINGTAIEAFWSGTSFLLCSTGKIFYISTSIMRPF